MHVEQVKIDQMYPTARRLFEPSSPKRRSYRLAFVWLIAGAVAVFAAQRIVDWIDRNL